MNSVLDRVKAFLPEIQNSNAQLLEKIERGENVVVESFELVQDCEEEEEEEEEEKQEIPQHVSMVCEFLK